MKNSTLIAFTVVLALLFLVSIINADDVVVSEDGDEVIFRQIRNVRAGSKPRNKSRAGASVGCRYTKGEWSDCDTTTNERTRTLTLKRGDSTECESTKTEKRKCKKPCRYVKGQWSECDASVHMKERVDQLKPGSDQTCEATRRMSKKCKAGKADKKHHG